MHHRAIAAALFSLTIMTAACGGKSDNPATPTAAATPEATAAASATASPAAATATVAATSVAGSPTAAASPVANRTPQQLYDALLSFRFDETRLPSNYSKPQVSKAEPSANSKRYQAIGRVDIDVDAGSNELAAMTFTVYPNNEQAKKAFDDVQADSNTTITGNFAPQGITQPSKCLTARVVDSGQSAGITVCGVQVDNVIVSGNSALPADQRKGNSDGAVALAKAGLAHLQAVQSGSGPQARGTVIPTLVATRTVTPAATATLARTATAAATGTAAANVRTPQGLLTALENTPFPRTDLSREFTNPRVTKGTPGVGDKQNAVVGQVDVQFDGPSTADFLHFVVFENEAQARARFDFLQSGVSGLTGSYAMTGLPAGTSNICLQLETEVKYGNTTCIVLVGNVHVRGITLDKDDPKSGFDENSEELVKAGVKHLQRIQQGR